MVSEAQIREWLDGKQAAVQDRFLSASISAGLKNLAVAASEEREWSLSRWVRGAVLRELQQNHPHLLQEGADGG